MRGHTRLPASGHTRDRLYSAKGGRVRAVRPQPEQLELSCTFQQQIRPFSGRTNSKEQADFVAVLRQLCWQSLLGQTAKENRLYSQGKIL